MKAAHPTLHLISARSCAAAFSRHSTQRCSWRCAKPSMSRSNL